MPERVTKEEKIVELAILKAKEILQEAEHLGTLELDENVMGEEMKVKKPKKNPSEVKMGDMSNIDGKEDKVNDGTMKKSILVAVDDLLKVMAEQETRDITSGAMNTTINRIGELADALREASGDAAVRIQNNLKREVDKLTMLTTSGQPSQDTDKPPMSRRF
tara:strand:- start:153 stop:638 length:486 start_codon:yes stop_codon:yes gene_type:complete